MKQLLSGDMLWNIDFVNVLTHTCIPGGSAYFINLNARFWQLSRCFFNILPEFGNVSQKFSVGCSALHTWMTTTLWLIKNHGC